MQDRPTAPELLEALAEYLYSELRPHVPPEQRFKTLVAANVCAVVAREIRAGAEPALADVALFREILGVHAPAPTPEQAEAEAREAARELSLLIRHGDLDSGIEGVASKLREHVRRKLEIARPGYTEG